MKFKRSPVRALLSIYIRLHRVLIVSGGGAEVIQTMEKLSKQCIIKMTETNVHIICLGDSDVGVQIWS